MKLPRLPFVIMSRNRYEEQLAIAAADGNAAGYQACLDSIETVRKHVKPSPKPKKGHS